METAKLIQDDQGQIICLPKKFHFEGEQVFIKKLGNAVVLIPKQKTWDSLFNSLSKFSDDFMLQRIQPAQQRRKNLFL